MARISVVKSSFTGGEIAPDLIGRAELKAFENGASKLRNVFIAPTGGVYRRPGLSYVAALPTGGRLVPFEFNTEQTYLMAFLDQTLKIFKDAVEVAEISTDWTLDQVSQLYWTQSADTLLITHPDVAPKKITRTSHTDWTISDWKFLKENSRILQPMRRFGDDEVEISASATGGLVNLTATADVFQLEHVGTRFRLAGKEVEISAFNTPTSAAAITIETLVDTSGTKDWEEQAFSPVRGWPVTCCFHQDRLVIGGSRDLPNRLWMSKSADLFNFDLGEGLDDEAIEFALLSDQVNAIRGVFSGRHLQIFTSGAEWMATGSPLTPASIQLNRQTRIGSPTTRTILPRNVDGATLFAPRVGQGLFEFLFADPEQAYQATNLALLSRHLINGPQEMDYDSAERLLHIVMQDGTLATVTIFRAEKVTGWSLQSTQGLFRSIAQVGEETYLIVERDGLFQLERFDNDVLLDAAITQSAESEQSVWSGLDHLEGQSVQVVADETVQKIEAVSGGSVTLDAPATTMVAGLPYTHEVAPMPPSRTEFGSGVQGGRHRLIAVTLRLKDTFALSLDVGSGLARIPFLSISNALLDAPVTAFTGDKRIRAFGWKRDGSEPLWTIQQEDPVAFNLLSVASEVASNG
ncbi:MAG: hypothetical protein ACPGOV_13325 [Magnetovibrionaceae bacterium]